MLKAPEPILFIDSFEPPEIVAMLRPAVPEVVVAGLNSMGYADYLWTDVEGNVRQWERKQASELLSDLDGVEAQLNEELKTCQELTLVVEGFVVPTADGAQTYVLTPDGKFFRQGYRFRKQPQLFLDWLSRKWSLERACGVQVVETPTLEVTAYEIATAFKQSMKPKHTTLQRYCIPHIPPFDPDIHVENLARLKDCGVGVERARKLIARYGTFWGAVSAEPPSLARVLGPKVAAHFLNTIGRLDV